MRQTDKTLHASQRSCAQDVHQSREWFDLLALATLPPNTEVTYWPLGRHEDPDGPQLPLIRLTPNGKRVHALSNYYTPIFGAVGEGPIDEAALTDCFRKVRCAGKQQTALLQLAPLAVDEPLYPTALRALRAAGWIADTYFCFANWYTREHLESFAGYFAKRPSELRNTIERAKRKLNRHAGFRLEIHSTTGEQLEQAIRDFEALYLARWQRSEPHPEFIPRLCRLAASLGWLRLGLLHVDGKPAAAQIWLVGFGKASIVKLPYDPAYGKLSVGSVLTAHLMEHVIDHDRVTEIDYLIGDEPYKRNWTPSRRERRGIIAFNPACARGIAHALHHFGGKVLRTLIKPRRHSVSGRALPLPEHT